MSRQIWLNTTQAGQYVGRHRDTVLKALEGGELHGHQRIANGRWSIHVDCLDAWVGGETCPRHDKAGAA